MKRRWWKRTGVAIMALVLLAACSSNQNSQPVSNDNPNTGDAMQEVKEQVELRMVWWGSQNRHDRTLQVIEMFEDQYPHITINSEFSGWDGYWEKLATQAAGRNLPDIIQMDMQYMSEYVSRELLANLEPFVASGVLDLSDVDETYLSGGRFKESLFALNIGANALALAIDPAMYEEAGVPIPKSGYTWDDFIRDARLLKENLPDDAYVRAVGGAHEFRHYLRNHGKDLYAEDGLSLGYEDDQLLTDFFAMWDELRREGVVPPPDVTSMVQGLEDELIVHGKAPNHSIHSNQIIALISAAGRPLDMVIYPSIDGGEFGHYLKPGQFLSVSAHSANPEEAALFLSFFTNSLEANEVLAAERGVPIAAKVREHLYPTLDEVGQGMFDYMDEVAKYAREVPFEAPGAGGVIQAFDRAAEALSYGQSTPEEAARSFRAEAEEILDRNAD